MSRSLLLLAALVFGAAQIAVAQDQRTPQAVISEIYAFYSDNGSIGIWPTDPMLRPLFTDRLMALLDADDVLAERDGMGRLSFDPFVNAQDFAIEDFRMSLAEPPGDQARVEVRFQNFGDPTRLIYHLERQGDGLWQIDDIEAPDGAYPWRLVDILGRD